MCRWSEPARPVRSKVRAATLLRVIWHTVTERWSALSLSAPRPALWRHRGKEPSGRGARARGRADLSLPGELRNIGPRVTEPTGGHLGHVRRRTACRRRVARRATVPG